MTSTLQATITATVEIRAFGPAIVVNVEGEARPWEFSARAAAVRTPLRRAVTLARAVDYVRGRLEAQPAPALELGKAA